MPRAGNRPGIPISDVDRGRQVTRNFLYAMRRFTLIVLISLLLVLILAAAAHADYWPPSMAQQLIKV